MSEQKRYQECGYFVRCYRWWCWMPIAYVVAILYILIWILEDNMRPMVVHRGEEAENASDAETAGVIWKCVVGRFQIRMGRYYTMDEAVAKIRSVVPVVYLYDEHRNMSEDERRKYEQPCEEST